MGAEDTGIKEIQVTDVAEVAEQTDRAIIGKTPKKKRLRHSGYILIIIFHFSQEWSLRYA